MIIGAGPAGDAVAAGLRDAGFAGEIVLVDAAPAFPYERPHLSKRYLLGAVPREKLGLRRAEQYRALHIELRLGERVAALGIEIRGEFGSPPFTVFYLKQGRLVAAAGINDHHTVARARRVIQERACVTVDQLADPRFDLRRALA